MRIDEMPSGREMDKAISQYVFGNTEFVCHNCEDDYHVVDRQGLVAYVPVPNYSIDISAAWEVAEKLRITVTPDIGHGWKAAWCNASGSGETTWVGMTNRRKWIIAETAPLAICRAALEAMGVMGI